MGVQARRFVVESNEFFMRRRAMVCLNTEVCEGVWNQPGVDVFTVKSDWQRWQ